MKKDIFTNFYIWKIVLTLVLLLEGGVAYNQPSYEGVTLSKLENGGYKDVVIAINNNVKENDRLIVRIEKVLTDFSKYLYRVTREKAYLREVRILFPSSWSGGIGYISSTWERFERSDIRIDNPPEDTGLPNRHLPYTNKPTFCGSPGFYIHLTPEYLLNETIASYYGDYSKVLAHEWAHNRWGVFDEYPTSGDGHFYTSSSGNIEGVRCSAAIKGIMKTVNGIQCHIGPDGVPGDDCRFFDSRDSNVQPAASLMYKQYLDQVDGFCDDPENANTRFQHNAEAPNLHNRQCNSKSIWEVMQQHPDFIGKNSENADQDWTAPTFIKVRERPSRYVLVIDNSASMTYRLINLRQACYIFIYEVLHDDEELAIVEFNNEGLVRSNLTTVGPNRENLVKKLPSHAEGSTSIGSGLLQGLNVLNRNMEIEREGGRIIVLTDGEENRTPNIKDVINQTDPVVIHTIAIGNTVDKELESLAVRTGGQQFLHQDASTTLFNIFSQFGVESRGSKSEELVSQFFQNLTQKNTTFFRDNSLRGGIKIYIGINGFRFSLSDFTLALLSPSGQSSGIRKEEHDIALLIITTNSTEVGTWTLVLNNTRNTAVNASVLVLADAEVTFTSLPISANGIWSMSDIVPPQIQTAYLTLARGYNPVIDTTVKAAVDTPAGMVNMTLYDDGIGEDIIANDGVYSGFYTHFYANSTGRYSAQFSVEGEGRIVNGARLGVAAAAVDPILGSAERNVQYESAGNVQRTITGGVFTCNNKEMCTDINIYAPYKITDLKHQEINSSNKEFTLTFHAPGADLMAGTASYYEIRFSKNFTTFNKQFTNGNVIGTNVNEMLPYISVGDPTAPLIARSQETFRIKLPPDSGDVLYFFALTTSDGELISPPSNIVSVLLGPESSSSITTVEAEEDTTVPAVVSTSDLLPVVIAASSLLLLLLFISLLLLLLLRQFKQEKKIKSKKVGGLISEDVYFHENEINELTVRGVNTRDNKMEAQNIEHGDLGTIPYLNVHNKTPWNTKGGDIMATGNVGSGSSDNANIMGQGGRHIDPERSAGVRSDKYTDNIQVAEKNYNFLPGNANGTNDICDAKVVNAPHGDYNFLAVDALAYDSPRQASKLETPGNYQFLPADVQEYSALRLASIQKMPDANNQEQRKSQLADALSSSNLFRNRQNAVA